MNAIGTEIGEGTTIMFVNDITTMQTMNGHTHIIHAQTIITSGLEYFNIIGVSDVSVNNLRDTIRNAVKTTTANRWPTGRITVNMAPAITPKNGRVLSAAIAVSILMAMGEVSARVFDETAVLGIVHADGTLTGCMINDSQLDQLNKNAVTRVIVPEDAPINDDAHPDLTIVRAATLADCVSASFEINTDRSMQSKTCGI